LCHLTVLKSNIRVFLSGAEAKRLATKFLPLEEMEAVGYMGEKPPAIRVYHFFF